eukprot:TRINITY_DN8478_c0_g1::TRINITY_DN8478_c0_g1_i1::g.3504::m.3504 TRINITY_DN8478_c0_g1::TRINITY_DN8478_c0_g1_i1::g.3504  ORF type:complete len:434 (-),score=141.95,sp/Q0P5L8/KBL_BOVIN/61.50/1e-180,Aminotran_1_2/PF00155.16/1.3e-71,Aminotran_5/PF00266.14/4.4e-05,SHMT/PF00464.14/5.2e-05,Beta_elim_lyase/PF01212.16/0.00038,Cys_Met_Meta_PP/PF01053.15/0.0012,OKR_DC_1/PF01276.15/0.32,HATPase_c_5/PF14501.1/0.11,DNA_photolyase/PF00875.13/83,DNA_photolyase/PF00875.13/2.1,DegT_DnrJ_EryC1/PF01041.12/0.19 TRINITY
MSASRLISRTYATSAATQNLRQVLGAQLTAIEQAGTFKKERIISSPQTAAIKVRAPGATETKEVLNFCANNYLGLSDHPALIEAAKKSLDSRGFGLSSVRFICGTQDIHKELERKISEFHKTEDSILYSSAFDANAGLFEAILTEEDAIISDELNHASIIDGIRLCKAKRFRYTHLDLKHLEAQLQEAQSSRLRLIVTDGVFSMDGHIAPLKEICDLADKYNAQVFVDDSHASGFVGKTGRGTPELCGVMDRVDIINSTLGKALGGATGGFTTGRKEVIDMLRQKSRPYLFSNTLAPPVVAAGIRVFDMLSETTTLRDKLEHNTMRFREKMTKAGFNIMEGIHPIVPIMLGDARLATAFADDMLNLGIYVIGFSFPVVPKGKARIRVQISAAHSTEDIDKAVDAFVAIGKKHNVIA